MADTVMIAMRDGVDLATDVHLPKGGGPFPAVLSRVPYGKATPFGTMPDMIDRLLDAGYAYVVQDVRGKWGSGGTFDASDIDAEAEDGFDTVQWIADQSWSNGRVGMWGNSYYGYTCFAAASLKPPGLVCIAPGNQGFDRYNWSYRSGCLKLASEGIWGIFMLGRVAADTSVLDLRHLPLAEMADHAGLSCSYFDDVIAHPERAMRYWTARNRLDAMLAIDIPVLHWTGWYDNFIGPMVEEWQWLRDANPSARHNHLMIGPWDHYCTSDTTQRVGLNQLREGNREHRWQVFLGFFDRYLKQQDNGFGAEGLVHYFTLADNSWRDADTWPPAGCTLQTWHLHSAGSAGDNLDDGRLDGVAPGDEPADHYTFDPADPVAWSDGTDAWRVCEAMDDRQTIEARSDVLTFTSEPLAEPLEISGPLKARLYVESDAPDTDFSVALVDVFPDGRVNLIQDGIQRAALRDQDKGRQLLEPGKVYVIDVDMWSVSYQVPAGHRLRVEVSSSDFPRYDRNLNTDAAFGHGATTRIARQTIHHDETRPSHIVLPVMSH